MGVWNASTTPLCKWWESAWTTRLTGMSTYRTSYLRARKLLSWLTGYSPFELLFGKHAHDLLDILWQQGVPTSKTLRDAIEWLYNLREMLDSMRMVAANWQKKIKEYSKSHNDKNATERFFSKGDCVFFPPGSGWVNALTSWQIDDKDHTWW